MRCDVAAAVTTAGNRTLYTSLTSYTQKDEETEKPVHVFVVDVWVLQERRAGKKEKGRVNVRWARHKSLHGYSYSEPRAVTWLDPYC